MVHTYKTTHRRHKAYHGFRFALACLSLLGMISAFRLHWLIGVILIFPNMLLYGLLVFLVDAHATYLYLRRDCKVDVTWAEAKKLDPYFSPNKTGHWIDANFLQLIPKEHRREALFEAIADFDSRHGKLVNHELQS